MVDGIALLATASLRATLVLGAAWLVALALRRASATARHLVWTCAVVAAVLTPTLTRVPAWRVPMPAALSQWWSSTVAPTGSTASTVTTDSVSLFGYAATTAHAPARPETAPSRVSAASVALAIWALGFV